MTSVRHRVKARLRRPTRRVRRLAPVLLCLALSIGLTACSGAEDPETAAGAAGAFGGADDCSQSVEETVAARARVLHELGDARRNDSERIDAALTAFGPDPVNPPWWTPPS